MPPNELQIDAGLTRIPGLHCFIATKLFTGLVEEYLTDDEYGELQWFLASAPESAPVIPGTGGVRKLRWRAAGRGKRGATGSYTI